MQPDRPLALVYRGPASLPGCPEAVAALLIGSRWDLDVRFVGPKEDLSLSPEVLAGAVLYAQPGGGELTRAYRKLRRQAPAIRDFVRGGGRYLGFCLGGYLAGQTPGFGLLPGDTDQYVASRGATLAGDGDALVAVRWRGRTRELYFQDGPYFVLDPAGHGVDVLAVYDNGLPAAVVAPYGRGVVGVVGPHPEATPDWFSDSGLRQPERPGIDLGLDLLDTVLTA
ncbi:BPL-N domain-containing protein [Georgenia sp. SYP-B2076]|uniref:BPL-N domain-containing protein n=1 Tax=Georgenia sp. SYP-B2076 TaxID=2495881 RepID=UPI000F8D452B|nr:BPL-N domain-containing protein [Georgenia sp. SYP-B2076]